jgi:hypothetical protein
MTTPPDELPLIDSSHAAFITRGVSISVSSCGADLMPSIARAFGCRVSTDRHEVTLLVSRRQADDLLAHVRERGVIAAAFSEPRTQRTIQLKGVDASTANCTAADLQLASSYRTAFSHELSLLGFSEPLIHTLLSCPATDIASITFSPSAAFAQTPGPNAGQVLLVHA